MEFALMWANQASTLYHGTDEASARAIEKNGIDLKKCKALTDFGRGFYTTTNLDQTWAWAAKQALDKSILNNSSINPVVLEFSIDRDGLASLDILAFIRAGASGSDYWSFVTYCRNGGSVHARQQQPSHYQCVSGPVSLWDRIEILQDSDQFSFHDQYALHMLKLNGTLRSKLSRGTALTDQASV